MRKMKIIILTMMVLAASIIFNATISPSAAAEAKPVLIVSLAGYDELVSDIQTIGQLADKPELSMALTAGISTITRGRGPDGLNRKQPIGMVVLCDENNHFSTYTFLPVSDLNKLLDVVSAATGVNIKNENGIYEVPWGTERMFVIGKGDWAYVSKEKQTLNAVSPSPLKLIGDLPDKYLFAVRAVVKNIPAAVRQMASDILLSNMITSQQRSQGDNDANVAASNEQAIKSMKQFIQMCNQMDEVVLGFALDRRSNSFSADIVLTAESGTRMLQKMSGMKPSTSDFIGLKLPGAALTINSTAERSKEEIAQAKSSLETFRNLMLSNLDNEQLTPAQLAAVKNLIEELYVVLAETTALKNYDIGASLVLEPAQAMFIAGSRVANGEKLDSAIRKYAAFTIEDDPNMAKWIKLDYDIYQDVRFHLLSIPTPSPHLVPLVGQTLDIVLGVGDGKVYIAAGRHAGETLKKAIERSRHSDEKEIAALEATLCASKIAKFVSAVAVDPQVKAVAGKMASDLEQSDGMDHITIVMHAIVNGCRINIEVEKGVVKALSRLGFGDYK